MTSVQDDRRENELINLFNLSQDKDRSRSDIDAFLLIDGKRINFELKSTTDRNRSVTTARDFSLNHIEKMRNEHWLIGFYNQSNPQQLEYCLYASPIDMKPWLDKMEKYLKPDVLISSLIRQQISLSQLEHLLEVLFPAKKYYTINDAQIIQKRQYTREQYIQLCNINVGSEKYISKENMLNVIKARALYLLSRGTTLNNPHIPGSYFNNWQWPQITDNYSAKLQECIISYLEINNA